MTAFCLFCGLPAVAWHHCTGRAAPRSAYLDRSLVVPLCQRHHDREHELLRRARLEFLPPGADPLGHRLARVLDLMGRCADHGRQFVLAPSTPYGNAVIGLHVLLLEMIEAEATRQRDGAA
ncbi:MAG: hypothetical protein ABSD85_11760 [Acidimicrobiales bacterium]|jgi:hypothetical protein